ncbi:MAG: tRNA 4-thiouridine(8) synthase ThiI, partial [Proteobacteria bacterium]|nr:tRNA 4-thiouridine(8) synthase ThiI [Pseudomonadota bacterium]
QMEMAAHYRIASYPAPAGGCLLTDPIFSRRLRDLFAHHPDCRVRDIELLKVGRHFRINETTKIVVGRNAADNDAIERLGEAGDAVIRLARVPGPTALVSGGGSEAARMLAAALCARYSRIPKDVEVAADCLRNGVNTPLTASALAPEEGERLII